jgi:hypothetical protein
MNAAWPKTTVNRFVTIQLEGKNTFFLLLKEKKKFFGTKRKDGK